MSLYRCWTVWFHAWIDLLVNSFEIHTERLRYLRGSLLVNGAKLCTLWVLYCLYRFHDREETGAGCFGLDLQCCVQFTSTPKKAQYKQAKYKHEKTGNPASVAYVILYQHDNSPKLTTFAYIFWGLFRTSFAATRNTKFEFYRFTTSWSDLV